jgi:Xaa-Pro aminopeptidase
MSETDEPTAEPADNEPSDSGATASHDIAMPQGMREALTSNWDAAPPVPHRSRADAAPYAAARRAAISAALRDRLIVVPAGTLKVRANDTEYPFRASSTFAWLTAETAAEAVLVMYPDGGGHRSVLYVLEYVGPGELGYFTDRLHGALWVGNVPTPTEVGERLGIEVRGRNALPGDLEPYRDAEAAVLTGFDPSVDALLPRGSATDLERIADELRLTKDEWEIARLQDACDATTRGFEDIVRELPMVLARGGRRGERWLEGTFWRRARQEGNDVGYGSILGAGHHGTVLHWTHNDGDIVPGQLLLADMGVETGSLHTADVTRTLPVTGEWTPAQRRVYEAVREAQAAGIAEAKSGADFLAAHRAATWVLADHLHSWGILPVTAEVSCSTDLDRPGAGLHRRYTLHGVSHMLGIDVHDCAAARDEVYRDGPLAPGYVLTVEPGLYFQLNDRSVPAQFRGLAVRIEDDILVTDGDPVNLSIGLPREPDEISAWMADIQSSPASI